MKNIRYIVEYALLQLLFFMFKLIPVDHASAFGGWIGRTVGSRLAASRKALRNIEAAFPEKTPADHNKILREMWDNLGRVIAEYPHLEYIARHRASVEHADIIQSLIDSGAPAVFIGGHLANWELYGTAMLCRFDKTLNLTYRAPNNPWVDKLLYHYRTLGGRIHAHAKSRQAGRDVMRALKDNEYVGILIDQKFNEGLAVPFFDKPAMTNPAFVQLAQKFKCPLIPVRVVRLGGAHFRLEACNALETFDENGNALPAEDVIGAAHALMESWIKEHPEQWLWLHRRWDSKQLSDSDSI